MEAKARDIQVHPTQIKGKQAYQITYECGTSRRTLNQCAIADNGEMPPHGAGSFHDPEHHFKLLDRVETLLKPRP